MRTTLVPDDELLANAQALIERERARRLARLGGSEPEVETAPRAKP